MAKSPANIFSESTSEVELFHRFVDTSRQGMGWAELDGIVRYANIALCRMLEAPPEEIIGTQVLRFYSEKTKARLEHEIFPEILTQGTWSGELELRSNSESLAAKCLGVVAIPPPCTPRMNAAAVLPVRSGSSE